MQETGASLERQIEFYQRKYELSPHSRAFAPLADLYRKAGRLDEAIEVLTAGLAEHPQYVSALVILGRCHADGGREAQAGVAFGRVLELDPDNLVALKHLALMAEGDGDTGRAESLLGRVVVLDPTDESAARRLAALRGAPESQPAAEPALGEEPSEAPEPPEPAGPAAGASVADVPDPSAIVLAAVEEVREPSAMEPAFAAGAAGAEPAAAADDGQAGLENAPAGDAAPPVPPAPEPVIEPAAAPAVVEPAARTVGAPPAPGPVEGAPAAVRDERQSFATRTLAEIYLAQGYRDKALAVLRQILSRHPERSDVAEKIAELESLPPDTAGAPATPSGPAPAPEEGSGSRQHFDAWLERLAKPKERS